MTYTRGLKTFEKSVAIYSSCVTDFKIKVNNNV